MGVGPGNGDGDGGSVARVDESQEIERVRIRVNGVEIEVAKKVEVRELIKGAKSAGAIEGLVEEYVIERMVGEGERRIDETITVEEKEEFLAVPMGKTDVA